MASVLCAIAAALLASSCGSGTSTSTDSPASAPRGGSPKAVAIRIDHCLDGGHYRVQLLPPDGPGDRNAPDYAVAYQTGTDRAGGGEIAIYKTVDEASMRKPGIETNAQRIGGVVEQHGRITVVFFAKPATAVRDKVTGCVT
jgi:hypothetical protein